MEEFLTTRQVQDLLHVDRTTIYRLVANGQLPAVRVGRQWRFTRASVHSLLHDDRNMGPTATQEPDIDGAMAFPAYLSRACVQQLQDVIADLLGVMLVVTDMQGAPITEPSNVCGYYQALMSGSQGGLGGLCDATWPQLAAALPLKPEFVKSQLGPLCARAFIRVDNRLEGMLVAGCIAPEAWPPSEAMIGEVASRAGIKSQQLVEHAHAVHSLSGQELKKVRDVIQRVADIISYLVADHLALAQHAGAKRSRP